jgi:hypothetical protein
MISPRLQLTLEWDSYLVKLQEAQEYNRKQEEILAEVGYGTLIEMPIYDTPLEMAAGGVWQKVITVIQSTHD